MECKLHKDKWFENFKLKWALKRNLIYLIHSKHSWHCGSIPLSWYRHSSLPGTPFKQTSNWREKQLLLVHMPYALILWSKSKQTWVKMKTGSTNIKVTSVVLYLLLGKKKSRTNWEKDYGMGFSDAKICGFEHY